MGLLHKYFSAKFAKYLFHQSCRITVNEFDQRPQLDLDHPRFLTCMTVFIDTNILAMNKLSSLTPTNKQYFKSLISVTFGNIEEEATDGVL